MPMCSLTSGAHSALPSPYTPNDGSTWRRTSTPDAQHEASFQHSRPFLEPSYSPHPPTFPRTSRTPYEPSPLQQPSPSDTISPRQNTSMRWSPGLTVGGPRDSQSRFGSTEDLRFSSTPASLQRYPSDFPGQLHLPDLQGSRSQMPSLDTTLSVPAGHLLVNTGVSTGTAPVQPEPQPVAYSDMERMDYPMKRRNRPQAHGNWVPAQGSSFWATYSPTSQPDPHATDNNPGPSARREATGTTNFRDDK
ncbi:hypothetical protein FS837_010540 [Tulasnella sp. UAMH 9824]|nr:hypothetical protein FS837_010540 [Tulasnella sp. UAMH 9824]